MKIYLKKNSILIANISEIIKKNGVFIIKDNIKLKNFFFEIQCITSEELNNKFFIVLKKITKEKNIFEKMNYLNEIFSFCLMRLIIQFHQLNLHLI